MFKIKHLFHGEVLKEYITTRKLAIIQRFIKSLKNGKIRINSYFYNFLKNLN